MSEEAGAGLQAFVEHVEALSKTSSDSGINGFAYEFALLREQSNVIRASLPHEAGTSPFNAMKNRYRDIIPFDHCRVVLPADPSDEDPGADYINASYIKDADGNMSYIAAQGPLSHTVDDFWRMVWSENAQIVCMACNIIEANRYKCSKYWPDVGEEDDFGAFTISTLEEKFLTPDFSRRIVRVKHKGQTREIINYHFLTWPDHGVPETPASVMHFVQEVRRAHLGESGDPTGKPPLIVHCSAGCGRTGTIIAIDIALRILNKQGVFSKIDIFNTVLKLREQRIAMVQTWQQLVFVYKALLQVVKYTLATLEPPKPDLPPRDPAQQAPPVLVDDHVYVNVNLMRAQSKSISEQRKRALTVIGKRADEVSSSSSANTLASAARRGRSRRVKKSAYKHRAGGVGGGGDQQQDGGGGGGGGDDDAIDEEDEEEEEEEEDIDEDGLVDGEESSSSRGNSKDRDEHVSRDGPLGFPNRIRKPRGPRPEPKAWTWSARA